MPAATKPGLDDLAGDVLPAVVLLGRVQVVSAAAQGQVLGARGPPYPERLEVVQLQLVPRVAATPVAPDERTPAAVAPPDLVPQRDRNVPAARRRRLGRGLLPGPVSLALDAP